MQPLTSQPTHWKLFKGGSMMTFWMTLQKRSNILYSTVLFGTVLYIMVLYCTLQYNTFTENSQNHFKVTSNGCKWYQGAKGARISRCWGLKVTRVTRVPRLKGLLRDRVFSRNHLRSSLTPEEGPSCYTW